MKQFQYVFQRYEKKYLMSPEQYQMLYRELREHMEDDVYGQYTICNIYYDTPDYALIRASVEKPAYKEKFRLRSYGVPDSQSVVFAEIKKKFNGIVYKRRIGENPENIDLFLKAGADIGADLQISREIRWFLQKYQPNPRVFIGYERTALAGTEDSGLRITFDRNLRWRDDALTLEAGDEGQALLEGDMIIMEVKVPVSVPLWLASALSRAAVRPGSFSKYGTCYQKHIASRLFSEPTRINMRKREEKNL